MKIFAIYLKVRFTEKPEWFDEFLRTYFEPVDLHITLIQPRVIEDECIADVELIVERVKEQIVLSEENKRLFFRHLVTEQLSDGDYICMLQCAHNDFLVNLQKELRSALSMHNSYLEPVTIGYEEQFVPHVTIADYLDEQRKQEAEKYFATPYRFEAVLEAMVLPIVENQSIESRSDPDQQRVFTW